jgi:hypothetical protein
MLLSLLSGLGADPDAALASIRTLAPTATRHR